MSAMAPFVRLIQMLALGRKEPVALACSSYSTGTECLIAFEWQLRAQPPPPLP